MDQTKLASARDSRQSSDFDTSVLPHCEICGDLFGGEPLVACIRCNSPFHRDCFQHMGSCATYGCGCTTARQWLAAPDVLALELGLTAGQADHAPGARERRDSGRQVRPPGSAASRDGRAASPAPARKRRNPGVRNQAGSGRRAKPAKPAKPYRGPTGSLRDALLKRDYKYPKGTLRGDWERFHRPVSDPVLGLLFMIASVASPFIAPVPPGTYIAAPIGFLFGILICLQRD